MVLQGPPTSSSALLLSLEYSDYLAHLTIVYTLLETQLNSDYPKEEAPDEQFCLTPRAPSQLRAVHRTGVHKVFNERMGFFKQDGHGTLLSSEESFQNLLFQQSLRKASPVSSAVSPRFYTHLVFPILPNCHNCLLSDTMTNDPSENRKTSSTIPNKATLEVRIAKFF